MGATFSWFSVDCDICDGTGFYPKNQLSYCNKCKGSKYINIFGISDCLTEENINHNIFYNINGFSELPLR